MNRVARLFSAALPVAGFLIASGARAEDLWITGATLIDGTGAPPVASVSVRVAGGRIAEVRRGGPPVVGASAAGASIGPVRVLDLRGAYLLPGLITLTLTSRPPPRPGAP